MLNSLNCLWSDVEKGHSNEDMLWTDCALNKLMILQSITSYRRDKVVEWKILQSV